MDFVVMVNNKDPEWATLMLGWTDPQHVLSHGEWQPWTENDDSTWWP